MKEGEKRATGPSIWDVANEAGVATSTVSRALTVPGRVSKPTRLKVERAAKKLGYTANQTARNLRVGKPRTVMIVLPEALYIGASQIPMEVLIALNKALMEKGFTLLIANVARGQATDEHILSTALGGSVSGVVLMGSQIPKLAGRSLFDARLPIVSLLLDLSSEGVPSLVSDEAGAISDTVAKLYELRHRQFLFVGGAQKNAYHRIRWAAMKTAISDLGLPPSAVELFRGDFEFSGGIRAGKAYLTRPSNQRPTAVICANDDTAIGFIKTVVDAGVRVPEDVSVVGFDHAPVGEFMTPTLSTIRQPTARLGQEAANTIVEMIRGSRQVEAACTSFSCSLVSRQSVKTVTRSNLLSRKRS